MLRLLLGLLLLLLLNTSPGGRFKIRAGSTVLAGIGMILAEGKEMKADKVDGMAEATAADTGMPKAAEAARRILEQKEIRGWRESSGSIKERWKLRWSGDAEQGLVCCAGPAGSMRKTNDGRARVRGLRVGSGRRMRWCWLLLCCCCCGCCSVAAADAARESHVGLSGVHGSVA